MKEKDPILFRLSELESAVNERTHAIIQIIAEIRNGTSMQGQYTCDYIIEEILNKYTHKPNPTPHE